MGGALLVTRHQYGGSRVGRLTECARCLGEIEPGEWAYPFLGSDLGSDLNRADGPIHADVPGQHMRCDGCAQELWEAVHR